MAKEKDITLIENYLAGRLTTAEVEAFERRLETEPTLAEALRVEQGMDLVLQAGRRDELNARMRSIREGKGQAKPQTPLWAWAAAASLALLVLVGLWQLLPGTTQEDLFDRHFSLYTTGGPVRATDPQSPFEIAWVDYLDGKYASAQAYFDSVEPGDSLFHRVRMYAAVCAIGRGELDDALRRLDVIAAEKGSPLHTEAQWYRGLVQLRREDWPSARAEFEKLAAEAPWYKAEAVKEILKTLEK